MTLTFDLHFTLTLSLTFDLDDLRKQILFKICEFCEVMWRKSVTSYVKRRPRTECALLLATNYKSLRLPVPKLWFKRWFSWFLICLTLTLTFQCHLTFENSPFATVHDWCKFRSDMFINSGDIAHSNMEKLPILYNGNFRSHENVCYVFRIHAMFCILHRICPSNMCVNIEKNRLKIDDCRSRFPFFINSTISHQ